MKKINELSDAQLCKLIDNRWNSSDSLWDIVNKTYTANLKAYQNNPDWLQNIAKKKSKVRANRIFVNMESVINSLISNPPKPTILSGRDTPESKSLATKLEKYFQIKYTDRNVKEVMRKGLRNLYLGRLIVLKPYWDARLNDFNVRPIDPRNVRFSKNSTKEDDSEFAIEEIPDSLAALLRRFPTKKAEILSRYGLENDDEVLVENIEVKYQEAWCWDYTIFKLDTIILGKIRNPYWDWDGLLVTPEEDQSLKEVDTPEGRKAILDGVRKEQPMRVEKKQAYAQLEKDSKASGEPMPMLEDMEDVRSMSAYLFNHFDRPRKPYIFATVFNNENTPVGQTDMITQALPLQEDIDETKRNVKENERIVNGIVKVDSQVMDKASAMALRFETGGVIWGKGVVNGVSREVGPALPAFVVENMRDSRSEIDDIMAASSAFKGVREGQETRGGRLALIEQSFLRLNELVQVIDYVNYELFNWFYQLAKIRYTEHHYAKTMGQKEAGETITLIQDDFEDGTEVRIIAGKTLPEDRQFKYEQAQADVKEGRLSPVDYFEVAGYDAPGEKAKNLVTWTLNQPYAVGMSEEEMQKIAPPKQEEDPVKMSLTYADLPPDGKVQFAAKAGITLNPAIVVAEEKAKKKSEMDAAKAKSDSMQQRVVPKVL